jgi:hypothetical protein
VSPPRKRGEAVHPDRSDQFLIGQPEQIALQSAPSTPTCSSVAKCITMTVHGSQRYSDVQPGDDANGFSVTARVPHEHAIHAEQSRNWAGTLESGPTPIRVVDAVDFFEAVKAKLAAQ